MATRRLKPVLEPINGQTAPDLLDTLAQRLDDALRAVLAHAERRIPFLGDAPTAGDLGIELPARRALQNGAHHTLTEGQQRAAAEVATLERVHGNAPPFLGLDVLAMHVLPEDALAYLDRRALSLAGSFSDDVLSDVKDVLKASLRGELTPAEQTNAIAQRMSVAESRGRAIAVTETTASFNQGRIAQFDRSGVDWWRFSAILDARTSPICRSRNGRLMRSDDPRWRENVPPLHPRCRSLLSPVIGRLEPQLIAKAHLQDWSDVEPLPAGWDSGVFRIPASLV